MSSDSLLEHDPPLVAECLLCQLPCVTGTQELAPECIKFQKYQWMPVVLLGREVRGYLAGQLERCADKFCVHCSSFPSKLKTTCFMKHTKTSTEVKKTKQTKKTLNTFSAHLANTLKMCPSSFPCVTAAVTFVTAV